MKKSLSEIVDTIPNMQDPIDGSNPSYRRGSGWRDARWTQFERVQAMLIADMDRVRRELEEASFGLKAGQRHRSTFLIIPVFESIMGPWSDNSELSSAMAYAAGRFEMALRYLHDQTVYYADGYLGAESGDAGTGEIGGDDIWINTGHPANTSDRGMAFTLGHEALHNTGLEHGRLNGKIAYRQGDIGERSAFAKLATADQKAALANPDHLMSLIFP